jgi:hypothetical protein
MLIFGISESIGSDRILLLSQVGQLEGCVACQFLLI